MLTDNNSELDGMSIGSQSKVLVKERGVGERGGDKGRRVNERGKGTSGFHQKWSGVGQDPSEM